MRSMWTIDKLQAMSKSGNIFSEASVGVTICYDIEELDQLGLCYGGLFLDTTHPEIRAFRPTILNMNIFVHLTVILLISTVDICGTEKVR
jgi:hypothetical protein